MNDEEFKKLYTYSVFDLRFEKLKNFAKREMLICLSKFHSIQDSVRLNGYIAFFVSLLVYVTIYSRFDLDWTRNTILVTVLTRYSVLECVVLITPKLM